MFQLKFKERRDSQSFSLFKLQQIFFSLDGQGTKNKVLLMSGSCHLDRPSNVEIGVEYKIFIIVFFFNCSQVLQFGAHSRYYKDQLKRDKF